MYSNIRYFNKLKEGIDYLVDNQLRGMSLETDFEIKKVHNIIYSSGHYYKGKYKEVVSKFIELRYLDEDRYCDKVDEIIDSLIVKYDEYRINKYRDEFLVKFNALVEATLERDEGYRKNKELLNERNRRRARLNTKRHEENHIYKAIFNHATNAYINSFGIHKYNKVNNKVTTNKKTINYIRESMLIPPTLISIRDMLNDIPFLYFSKMQTVAISGLIVLDRWNNVANFDYLYMKKEELNELALKILRSYKFDEHLNNLW